MVSTTFLDPRYRELANAGVIAPSGELDNLGMQDINAALRRPHGEAVKKSKYFHRRQNERRAEVQEQEYYDEQDDYISDEMYSAGMYTRSPSPVQNFRPVTPPLFPAITPPLTPPSRSVTLPSQSHVTVATISPQQLIARRVSPSPPAIAHQENPM
ncbi:hypothetical protein H0H92_001641, partial [Tricholoma furcatifolium]